VKYAFSARKLWAPKWNAQYLSNTVTFLSLLWASRIILYLHASLVVVVWFEMVYGSLWLKTLPIYAKITGSAFAQATRFICFVPNFTKCLVVWKFKVMQKRNRKLGQSPRAPLCSYVHMQGKLAPPDTQGEEGGRQGDMLQ